MEQLISDAARHIFSQGGLIGVLLVVSGIANYFQYKELSKLRDESKEDSDQQYEKRLEEARSLLQTIERNSNALSINAGSNEKATALQNDVVRSLATLAEYIRSAVEISKSQMDRIERRQEEILSRGRQQ